MVSEHWSRHVEVVSCAWVVNDLTLVSGQWSVVSGQHVEWGHKLPNTAALVVVASLGSSIWRRDAQRRMHSD